METINQDNFLEVFDKRFPFWAKETPMEISDGSYLYFGGFAERICDETDKKEGDQKLVDNAFEFFNLMAEEGDGEVENILTIEAFDYLSSSEKHIKLARNKLKGFALEMFERVVRFWPNGYMNLQMEEVSEENLSNIIIKHFFEFSQAHPNLESMECRDYLADFSAMLRKEMEKEKGDKLLMAKCFELFNIMGEKGDIKIQDALVSVALREIHDNGDIARRAWQNLEGKAKEYFEGISRAKNNG